jgi:hypothetical protein
MLHLSLIMTMIVHVPDDEEFAVNTWREVFVASLELFVAVYCDGRKRLNRYN